MPQSRSRRAWRPPCLPWQGLLYRGLARPLRLMVRTSGFQPENRGSIPLGGAMLWLDPTLGAITMRPNTVSTLALSTVVFVVVAASPAAAKIECRDNFQVTKNGLISTPYCEELQIARVARSYGYNVSDDEVRNNPNTKVYL